MRPSHVLRSLHPALAHASTPDPAPLSNLRPNGEPLSTHHPRPKTLAPAPPQGGVPKITRSLSSFVRELEHGWQEPTIEPHATPFMTLQPTSMLHPPSQVEDRLAPPPRPRLRCPTRSVLGRRAPAASCSTGCASLLTRPRCVCISPASPRSLARSLSPTRPAVASSPVLSSACWLGQGLRARLPSSARAARRRHRARRRVDVPGLSRSRSPPPSYSDNPPSLPPLLPSTS